MAKRAFSKKKKRPMTKMRGGRKVPAMFLGGLFGGGGGDSGGSSKNFWQTSGSNTNLDPGGNYTDLMHQAFGGARQLIDRPYQEYDPNQRFEGFTPDQLQAQQQVRNNQGAWQGNFNQAQGAFNQAQAEAGGVGTAGQGAFNQAATGPTGLGSADPYMGAAAGSWTDTGTADKWMSPYMDQVTNRIAELGNRNLMENVLPGVNDTFTGGGAAQFGRERHADITGRAIRDSGESILGAQAQALNQGYQQAQSAFGNEQQRMAGLAGTAGQLANADRGTNINLGQAQTQAAAQGVSSGLAAGQAQQGLGAARSQAGYLDAAALGQSGQQQQAFGQQQRDFDYAQNREAFNYPYTNLANIKNIATGWQLPTNTNSTSSGNQWGTGGGGGGGSTGGNIMGGLLAVGSMGTKGGGTVGGDFLGGLGGMFGGMGGGGLPQQPTDAGTWAGAAKGGHIKPKRAFGAGGYAAVVNGVRRRQAKRQPAQQMRVQAMQGIGQQNPGLMPPKPAAFGKGGKVEAVAAVHKHERKMHKGQKLTAFAGGGPVGGGPVDDTLLDDLGYEGQFLRSRVPRYYGEEGGDRPMPFQQQRGSGVMSELEHARAAQGELSGGEPPSAFGRAARDAGEFGKRAMGETKEAMYRMLPTVAYSDMVEAVKGLRDAKTGWDYAGSGADLALGAFGMTPGAAIPTGAGRKMVRGARDYLRSAFGRR